MVQISYKEETLYYPQDEMHTFLLPVTSGCTWNRCAFCSMYKNVAYRQIPFADIEAELRSGNLYTEKVFLTGADPMSIGFDRMKRLLEMTRRSLPYCHRVGAYASIKNIAGYSVDELSVLHDAGLRMLYIGFETGRDDVLKLVNKGHTVREAVEGAQKLNAAKIPFCTVLMYGIAGAEQSVDNAVATAELVNRFATQKIITMSLIIFNNTELNHMVKRGEFAPPSGRERMIEIRTLLENLEPEKPTVFDTTHPSNIIKIRGTLPWDRRKLIKDVERHAGIS
ncbi:MAG: radical SAM protein [Thermovirgaceae bacterium]